MTQPLPPLPTILTSADDPLIRMWIRSNLGVGDLPDVAVEMAFSPATNEVLAIDPQAGTWPTNSREAKNDHDAAVLFAAAWLMPSVPLVIREAFQGYSYGLDTGLPLADRIAMLKEQAVSLLALNLGESLVELMQPTMMTLAPGGRGDVSQWAAFSEAGQVTLSSGF